MPFLHPSAIRFARLRDIKGPALLIPHEKPGEMLLVGVGHNPLALFLSGRRAAQGFRLLGTESLGGLAFENVELEIDHTSFISRDTGRKPPMSAFRRGTSVGLFVSVEERSLRQTMTCEVATDLSAGSDDTPLLFDRWRLLARQGDDAVELFSFDQNAGRPSVS